MSSFFKTKDTKSASYTYHLRVREPAELVHSRYQTSSFKPEHKLLSYEIEKRGALAPILQTLYSAICWINHYPADTCYEHQLCYPLDWIDINPVDSVVHLFNNWGQELIKDLFEYSAHALGACDGYRGKLQRCVACLYCWLLHSFGSITVDSF